MSWKYILLLVKRNTLNFEVVLLHATSMARILNMADNKALPELFH
jgi:hypothetical protein